MIPFGAGVISSSTIARDIGQPNIGKAAWIAASYPLTQGAFILPGGRLGAKFGHRNLLFVGSVIWVAFTLGSGFAPNFVALCILRGFTGIGGGIMVPNGIAVLGITFPPGRLRNLAMGLFGMAAPLGAAGGGILAGLIVNYVPWKWMFFTLTILGFVVFSTVLVAIPGDEPVHPDVTIDYIGSYLGVAALILFNFVWNQAPTVGWQEPYEYVLLIISIIHAVAFCLWEMRGAKDPILPFTIWRRPSFGPLLFVLFLVFMAFGILLWYIAVWQFTLRDYSVLGVGGTFGPLAISGMACALLSAWLVPILPAQVILGIGICGVIASCLLVATMPEKQLYWKQMLPAGALMGLGPDFVATMGSIIAANSVKRHEQGVAGTLIGVLQTYGLSTGLGFAGTVESQVNEGGRNLVKGYRGALYLAVGFCVLALAIDIVAVRVPKETQEGWKEGDLERSHEKHSATLPMGEKKV
ncbi:MFS general substrate transporter [Auriscalpium vulgare]|uniref:MFS general substrate transporter n=1 Tax=Auriscalpium vulgare TaxID=40419 RepID=A0ACB8RZJ1_9AGAM|nr:MFS general substrate transporter [Auriscalpium vulgare]